MINKTYQFVKWGDRYLENMVPGYQTINIYGRGALSPEVESLKPKGRDGDYIIGKRLPSREITIEYILTCKDHLQKRDSLNLLHSLLLKSEEEMLEIGDEIGWFRRGFYIGGEDPPDDRKDGIGRIKILTTDPYRYSELRSVDLINGRTTLYEPDAADSGSFYTEKIEVTISNEILTITNLTNGDKLILREMLENQKVSLDFLKAEIRSGATNLLKKLAFESSDFPDFRIKHKDTIELSGGSGRIYYRIRSL
ncbi:MAG: phage tail family protein [Firmicutes bacterium]|nr:phage tail family protein [Bacillota bacterium]